MELKDIRKHNYRVEFIRVWQDSSSLKEVASRLSITTSTAKKYANRFKNEGYTVPSKAKIKNNEK